MEIRRFQEDDAEAVAAVHAQAVREIAADDYTAEEIAVWADTGPSEFAEEDKERFVAVDDGTIVGFSDYAPEEQRITGMYVHPDWTGVGVGSALLECVEQDARERSITKLDLLSTVTAKAFYENHGYTVVEKTTREMEDEALDVYRMEKALSGA